MHCQHVLRVLGERLGIGIANAINTFDPDEVVIGGGVSLAGDLLLVPAERTARRHTVPGAGMQTKIRLARHGPQAGVLGAATVAAQEWAHEPGAETGRRTMRIACAFDHAGFPLKPVVLETLEAAGHEPIDLGTYSTEPGRLPGHRARRAAEAVLDGRAERAVVVCGSGAGVAVAACKIPGIRAATAHDTYTAHQAVEHDDVNVLCLGARVIGPALRGGDHRGVRARRVLGRGAPRAAAGEDHRPSSDEFTQELTHGGRRRARGRLPPDRRARARRRPAHGRARRHERARSTGTAARRSTRRACSARSSTRTTAASTRSARPATTGRPSSSTSRTRTS